MRRIIAADVRIRTTASRLSAPALTIIINTGINRIRSSRIPITIRITGTASLHIRRLAFLSSGKSKRICIGQFLISSVKETIAPSGVHPGQFIRIHPVSAVTEGIDIRPVVVMGIRRIPIIIGTDKCHIRILPVPGRTRTGCSEAGQPLSAVGTEGIRFIDFFSAVCALHKDLISKHRS